LLSQTNTDMNKKVKHYIKTGRDSIIKTASHKIGEAIDIENCIVQVKASKTSVIVSFHNPILYIPKYYAYNYNHEINIIDNSSCSIVAANPEDFDNDDFNIPNYFRTKEHEKHILFVLNAVQKSNEVGSIQIEDFSFDNTMIIRNKGNFYKVNMLSPYQESFYKIDKVTEKIYDAGHTHFIPPPVNEIDEEIFEIIK